MITVFEGDDARTYKLSDADFEVSDVYTDVAQAPFKQLRLSMVVAAFRVIVPDERLIEELKRHNWMLLVLTSHGPASGGPFGPIPLAADAIDGCASCTIRLDESAIEQQEATLN